MNCCRCGRCCPCAVVGVGHLQQGHQVAADVAGLAVIGDLEPFAVEADDEAGLTLARLVDDGVVRARTAANVGHIVEAGIAELDVFTLLEMDVILVHVAGLEVAVDQIPVAEILDDHNGVAVIGLTDDLAVGARLRAQPQAGGGHDADAGFQLFGMNRERKGAQDRNDQNQRNNRFTHMLHKYPRFQNHLEDRALSSQTQPTSRAV